MSERIVHCRLLKKDLPGLDRPPYRNELGRRIFEEVSKAGSSGSRTRYDSSIRIGSTLLRPRARSSCSSNARSTSATKRGSWQTRHGRRLSRTKDKDDASFDADTYSVESRMIPPPNRVAMATWPAPSESFENII